MPTAESTEADKSRQEPTGDPTHDADNSRQGSLEPSVVVGVGGVSGVGAEKEKLTPLRILACGGRDYLDTNGAYAALDMLHEHKGVACLIHGAARGADTLAAEWAKARGIQTEAYPANWHRDGKAAGPIRNQRMLIAGRPDGVVAFPGGRGTADMIGRAEAAGLKVWRPYR